MSRHYLNRWRSRILTYISVTQPQWVELRWWKSITTLAKIVKPKLLNIYKVYWLGYLKFCPITGTFRISFYHFSKSYVISCRESPGVLELTVKRTRLCYWIAQTEKHTTGHRHLIRHMLCIYATEIYLACWIGYFFFWNVFLLRNLLNFVDESWFQHG